MTNQEILTKAIQKAIDGGWTNFGHGKNWSWAIVYGTPIGINYTDDDSAVGLRFYDIIFNHDFAKALWGEYETHAIKSNGRRYNVIVNNKGWNHHLRMMVIADDPIKYLGENI